ncbi:MAG TPA: site-specific DNA-methyltransferase [Ferruginibacter sp.]|nr:site-specific DNA-methyltransferase [Ferruginibacter sp.]
MNHLYFGDCLAVLKDLKGQHPQPLIDLIYIDPPFNSKRNYNVLFESMDMKDANAQKQAFADTWSNYEYVDTLNELAELHKDLYDLLTMFHNLKSISDSATAYLTTMAIRIYYMHKLLKDTGSFYLHCDPTMSHYLKLVCDIIFGENNFLNEIVWKRTAAHSSSIKYGPVHDVILYYTKTSNFTWNKLYQPYDEDYLNTFFDEVDENGKKYQRLDLTGAGTTKGESGMPWRNIDVTKKGRHWAYTHKQLEEWDKQNKIHWPKKEDGVPRLKVYPEDKKGVVLQDIWNDIKPLHNLSAERLGYPTQKPEALLERIVKASSNEGDVVADFFCGCGTTIAAAQKLNRQWIGADISHLAVRLIKKRLVETYGKNIEHNLKLYGMPKDVASARELAQNVEGGRIGFQDWAIEVMLNGVVNEKKVADGGYDGYLTFFDNQKKKHFALIETKSGKLTVKNLREFVHVIETQKATVGIFVCFEENLTKEMVKCAKDAGHIKMDGVEYSMDKIQIITIEGLFESKQPQLPGGADNQTFKRSQRKETKGTSYGLFD